MTNEVISAIVVGWLLLFLITRKRARRRPFAAQTFTCHRCGAITPHNARTIGALRDGKSRFFCRPCHLKWLKTQPPGIGKRRPLSSRRSESQGGCLGLVALLVSVPLLGLAAWTWL
ncbi:hypothetical protein [Dyella sp. 333MFSha]|uniref:hypothetical protein n=1 Tax=Dyella sp. 333MFSha TaxID=1798240 RepID=UPI00115FF149|nr:hypothetical protein [Dyella sp. 333MFSha]